MNRRVNLGGKVGASAGTGGSMPSSSLPETDGQKIVNDTGHGAAWGMVQAGVALNGLTARVITHLHSVPALELATVNYPGPAALAGAIMEITL